jgi:hypothetical protein
LGGFFFCDEKFKGFEDFTGSSSQVQRQGVLFCSSLSICFILFEKGSFCSANPEASSCKTEDLDGGDSERVVERCGVKVWIVYP